MLHIGTHQGGPAVERDGASAMACSVESRCAAIAQPVGGIREQQPQIWVPVKCQALFQKLDGALVVLAHQPDARQLLGDAAIARFQLSRSQQGAVGAVPIRRRNWLWPSSVRSAGSRGASSLSAASTGAVWRRSVSTGKAPRPAAAFFLARLTSNAEFKSASAWAASAAESWDCFTAALSDLIFTRSSAKCSRSGAATPEAAAIAGW